MTVMSGVNRGMKWVSGSATHGSWLGTYEHDKQQLIQSMVKPGMTVYDIGANAGFYTLAFSRLVGPQGRVIAFEPLAENVASLRRHILLNGLSNVTVIQAAVSGEVGMASFQLGPNNAMGHLSGDAGAYMLPTVTLDGLVQSGTIPPPDLVKMDVEGAESTVLAGAADLLAQHRAVWLVALHGQAQSVLCRTRLMEQGYCVRALDGRELADAAETDEICAVPSAAG